jgi:hypothetical protein
MEEAEGLEIFVVSGRNQLGIEILADPNERYGIVASCGLSNQASEVQSCVRCSGVVRCAAKRTRGRSR